MGPYHNVAHYSAVGKVVLFGGGNNSKGRRSRPEVAWSRAAV